MRRKPIDKSYPALTILKVIDVFSGSGGYLTTRELGESWVKETAGASSTFYGKFKELKNQNLIKSSTNKNHKVVWILTPKGKRLLQDNFLVICDPPWQGTIRNTYFKEHGGKAEEFIKDISSLLTKEGNAAVFLDVEKEKKGSPGKITILTQGIASSEKTAYKLDGSKAKEIQKKLKELIS